MTIKKFHIFQKRSKWQLISLNNSKANSCFSGIFDSSDPYENYPDKKTYLKKEFWSKSQACASMHELQK